MALKDSWLLRVVLVAVATVGSLGISIVVAEAAVRYRESHRTSVPGTMPQLFYPHERMRQALLRNGHYYDWATTNANGFRGSRGLSAKDPRVPRVFAVGESTTFDAFVSADSLAWPAQLERALVASGCPAEVYNVGVPGYRMLDNLIRLEVELVELAPDVILLFEPNNDLFAAIRAEAVQQGNDPARPGEAWYSSRSTRWLLRHSELFAKLYARAGVERGRSAARRSRTLNDSIITAGAARYRREMHEFIAIAQLHGIKVVVLQTVTVSGVPSDMVAGTAADETWNRSFPGLSAEQVFSAYRAFDGAARAAASDGSVPFVELSAARVTGDSLFAPGDPIHFNDAGAHAMATALGNAPAVRSTACGR